MSSNSVHNCSLESLGKGKGRAEDLTERTPLLFDRTEISQAASYDVDERTSTAPDLPTHRLRSRLTVVFLTSLILCIFLFVVAALLAWSYAAKVSTASPGEVVQNALVFHGPESVNVMNTTSTGGVWVKVEARLGVDAGSVLGVNSDSNEDSFPRSLWKSLGRWGVGRVKQVSISLARIDIRSDAEPSVVLASLEAQPMTLPLTTNPPQDKSWLTPMTIILLIQPTNDTKTLVHFLRQSWQQGSFAIRVDVERTSIRGGSLDENSWRSKLRKDLFNVRTFLHVESRSLNRSIGRLVLKAISSAAARTSSAWRQYAISLRRGPHHADIIPRL